MLTLSYTTQLKILAVKYHHYFHSSSWNYKFIKVCIFQEQEFRNFETTKAANKRSNTDYLKHSTVKNIKLEVQNQITGMLGSLSIFW